MHRLLYKKIEPFYFFSILLKADHLIFLLIIRSRKRRCLNNLHPLRELKTNICLLQQLALKRSSKLASICFIKIAKQIQYMEETVSRIQRRNTARVDVHQTYHKLNAFIEKVNDKILNRIQLVQQVFLEDYKTQVKQMTDQLKSIRAVLDQQLLKQRANQRLFFLEEQRDFFRGQTTKLNEQLTGLSKENAKIKAKIEQVIAQAANYKQLVYSLQKKIAKVQNQAFQIERLKKSISKMPAISNQKETISISPTKTTLTRYSPLMSYPQSRPLFRSVELKNTNSKDGVDEELKRRDQILDDCIKDLKKKIFYRTAGGKQSQKFYFDEEKAIPFDKFTRTDKQELIKSILNRDDLLGQFYKFMVGRKAEEKLALKSSIANKSHFTDKIFKIKLCGLQNLSTN